MALTLYSDSFSISPYSFAVFVALEEKGIPFTLSKVSLPDKAHHRPEYRDASVTGRIPAIDHDGFWLAESAAIVDYLEEVFPAPQYKRALPEGPKERARARMVMQWIRSDLMPIREERSTHTMFYQRAHQPLSSAGQAAAARLYESASKLVPDGATSMFGGWTQADTDLAFMLQRLLINGHEMPAKLRHFTEAQWQRPSVQKWVALERPPYVAY
ncbi:MAG: glutathione transferase [Myxococcales bacterium]|nr:glutathione transferase [Myxococcales bacterium]